MNDTSLTIRSGAYGRSSEVMERAFVRSITVTRSCSRMRQSSSPYATSSAITWAAPRWSRQSVKPPVEAPTSSAMPAPTANLERVEGVRELDAATRHVRRRALDLQLHLGVDELAGFLGAAAAGADVDVAGDHGCGGARS